MSDNAQIVYFKGLRLADFVSKAPALKVMTEKPEFQKAIGGASAAVWDNGANASYQCTFECSMKRGFVGAETTPHAFLSRARTFVKTLKSVIPSGDTQFGPLVFVRDPDGSFYGKRDLTASVGVISAGSAVTIDVATAVHWGGCFALIADQSDPTNYEIVSVSSTNLGASQITIATLAKSYSNIVDIARIEWYWPEAALASDIELPVSGPVAVGFVQNIQFTFQGVVDPINGVLS